MSSCKGIAYFSLFFLLAIGWTISTAYAQEDEEDKKEVTTLKPMVVTARPIIEGNQTDDYGSVKTIITEDQLEDLNAQDLETALRQTPGINISRFNPVGSFGGGEGGGIFMRGMGSSRPGAEIKSLVDGAPVFMSVWNHPLLDLLSIDSAHTIEMFESPQPQNFGNAFGVINIVPKRKRSEGYLTKGEVSTGSFDTHIAKAEHGGNTSGWDYYIGGGFRESNGHRDHSEGELKNVYGRIGRQLSQNWDLTLFNLWNENFADDPGKEDADPSEREGRYETRVNVTTMTLSNEYEPASGEIKFYRSCGEGNWLGQSTETAGVTEDLFNNFLFYGVKAKETLQIKKGGELRLGADWDYTEGDYTKEFSDGSTVEWPGDHIDILSPYAAFNWKLGPQDGLHWTPSVGVRYYEHSNFNSEWSPHAGLIAAFGPAELHVGYSRGIIYPGLDVQVMSEAEWPELGQSWKDLDPEKMDHYEAGLSYKFSNHLESDIIFFYDDGQDRYVIAPPPPFPPKYANVENYTIKGTEATLNWQAFKSMELFAGVTLLDTDPSDLPYAPDTTINCGTNWRFLERFKLSLDGSYVSSMHVSPKVRVLNSENSDKIDSYYLINGKLSYAFNLFTPTYQGKIFVAGENLTDEEYEYQPGYPMPGINFMVGLQLEL
jgi:outer membrane receptor for ferrienterochelin and colicin